MNNLPDFYNKHYIKVDERNRIIDGWSDGPNPDRDTVGAICINDKGGYQFRLIIPTEISYENLNKESETYIEYLPTEENPNLISFENIPLYKYINNEIARRTQEEIDEDIQNLPELLPSESEQMRADIDFIAAMTGIEL